TGILGRKESLDAGPETEIPVFNSGTAENINDGNLATRVDTYGAAGTVSFVGILWDQPPDQPVERLVSKNADKTDRSGRAVSVSFVGILWDQPLDQPVVYLDLTL